MYISLRNFYLSKKEVFRKLSVQQTVRVLVQSMGVSFVAEITLVIGFSSDRYLGVDLLFFHGFIFGFIYVYI